MKNRNAAKPSKATPYRGNGKFHLHFGGSMFPRPLTEEEEFIRSYIQEKYGKHMAEWNMIAGTNMGKPIWLIRLANGWEIESYQGPHELETELLRMFKRQGIEVENG